MQIEGQVISDKYETYEKDGKTYGSRKLSVMDFDDKPLESLLSISIPEKSALTGDIHEGASLARSVVKIAITSLSQSPKSKQIMARGEVVQVLGQFRMEPAKPAQAAPAK